LYWQRAAIATFGFCLTGLVPWTLGIRRVSNQQCQSTEDQSIETEKTDCLLHVCVCSVIDRRGVVPSNTVNQTTQSSNGHQHSTAVPV